MVPLLPQSRTPLIKISLFFQKKDSMSYPDFYEHWRSTHGRLTVSSPAFDSRIVKYVQIINPSAPGHKLSHPQIASDLKAMGASEVAKGDAGWKWDGCTELYVRTWEDYLQFRSSKEFAKVLNPDGAKFIDFKKGLRLLVGLEDELFVEGKSKL